MHLVILADGSFLLRGPEFGQMRSGSNESSPTCIVRLTHAFVLCFLDDRLAAP